MTGRWVARSAAKGRRIGADQPDALRDPRSSGTYSRTRRAWLAQYRGQPGTCALCGQPVDTSLSGNHPAGPTVEHLLPIRQILATVDTNSAALTLACDVTLWALAHRRCQARQGAAVTNLAPQPTMGWQPDPW